jgi:AmiR/NasT family two-component response regulator
MFASQAAVVLANAQLHQACVDLTGQLEQALVSRAVIEQAKGIVMGRDRCDAEEAFLRLRRRSQHENRKVRDLARELVEQVTSA